MLTKEAIFTILKDWNPWYIDLECGTTRQHYVDELISVLPLKEIIFLKGVRRSGKSTLLRQVIYSLFQNGVHKHQILFVNFEDPRFANHLSLQLLDTLFEAYLEYLNPKGEIYLFLDEIQVVPLWEKWVRTKHELKKATIFVTGSTSKLLSKDIGTALSGRYVEKFVYPLSFQEFLLFKQTNSLIKEKKDILAHAMEIKRFFNEYILFGGFPKIPFIESKENKELELNAYFESIILKDIVARYNLKNYDKLKRLALFLLTNISTVQTINKLKNTLELPYDSCEAYVEYLKDCFLIFEVFDYSYSLKEQYKKPKKVYCIDLGLRNIISFTFLEELGKLYENLVFLELKKRYKEIYFYRGINECDFLIKEGLKITHAIQVTKEINKNNKKREVSGLLEVLDKFKLPEGTIITEDIDGVEKIANKKIRYISLWKYILG